MDNKNVFVAIALSMSVLLFWSAFFESPRQEKQLQSSQKENLSEKSDNQILPSLNQNFFEETISRQDSLVKSDRVLIENEKVNGSISLQGGILDDLTFKNYKKDLNSDKKVIFLHPKETKDGYFIETGWTSLGNEIKVPTNQTEWKVEGDRLLTEKNPVVLKWNNGAGLNFIKKIELDEKYLFKITQEVQNKSNSDIELYPYAQITRNKKPEDIMDFYILHEGFIGVFDGELKEDDYDDIKDKKVVVAPFLLLRE